MARNEAIATHANQVSRMIRLKESQQTVMARNEAIATHANQVSKNDCIERKVNRPSWRNEAISAHANQLSKMITLNEIHTGRHGEERSHLCVCKSSEQDD